MKTTSRYHARVEFQELHDALERFETDVAVPFVPGELQNWMNAVGASFSTLQQLVTRQIEKVHPEEFAEIGEENPGLFHRVEQLQEQDQRNRETLDALAAKVRSLEMWVPKVAPDEAALRDEMSQFVEDALKFVIEARRQETAVATWLQEAFNREDGGEE